MNLGGLAPISKIFKSLFSLSPIVNKAFRVSVQALLSISTQSVMADGLDDFSSDGGAQFPA